MEMLTTELKNEHNILLNMINEIKESGISTEAGLQKLVESKSILLNHLTKEDNFLYPPLLKRAKRDPYLKALLYDLSVDMDEITKAALAFYQKYENTKIGHFDDSEFGKEISMILIKLTARISLENRKLYPEFDKLMSSGKLSFKNIFKFLFPRKEGKAVLRG